MFVICPKCGAKYQIPPEISLNYGQKMQCSACGHYFVLAQENSFQKNESKETKAESVQTPVSVPPLKSEPIVQEDRPKQVVLPEVFQPSTHVIKRKTSLLLPLLLVVVSFFILLLLLGLAWQYREELQFQNQIDTLHFNRTTPLRTETKPASPVVQPVSHPIMEVPIQNEPVRQELEPEEFPVLMSDLDSERESDFSFRSLRFQVLDGEMGSVVQIEGIIKNEQNDLALLPEVIYVNAYDVQGKLLFQKEIYFAKKSLMPNQEQAFFGTYSPAPKEIKWIDVSFQK